MKSFAVVDAPFVRHAGGVRGRMAWVLLALVPGIAAHVWCLGAGLLLQIVLATATALICEATMLRLRGRRRTEFLGDLSAVVTAVLFALCVPSLAPWWIAVIGMVAAILIAKQLYGGLGFNLFNPAMVGVAVVLLCFPHESGQWIDADRSDGPIDHRFNPAWLWIVASYALGGVFLLAVRIIPWQVPVATIATTLILVLAGTVVDPSHSLPSWTPLGFGSLVLGAFFIATDPVTGCTTPRGRLLFGFGVAALTLLVQRWGHYSDGLAFAVLLMNCAAPWIDLHTRPRRIGTIRPYEQPSNP